MQTSRLTEALDARFDDMDEIKDVADHGCEGGVSGFIYYSETSKFFDEYQEEIEQQYQELFGNDYLKQILDTNNIQDIRTLKNNMVWGAVSMYCTDRAYT